MQSSVRCDSEKDIAIGGSAGEGSTRRDCRRSFSLRHVLLRGAASSATQRDLDRGGEEDVRNDGASGGSCSSRQKVEGFNVVAVWKHEEAMEKLRGVR